jgi:uncharacterized small protein (DUF1192 family)
MVANEESPKDENETVVRLLREEIDRLKAEIARLNRDRDERPPHYL